ncbi:uncharacterized protein TNCV_2759581 [Trichonephila clavipes]|nr:uncharacterized protein TNCV_2759581 [Trichonephila clavipes]
MSSKSARRSTDYRRKKRRFCGNQHSKNKTLEPVAVDVTSASSKKLCLDSDSYQSIFNEICFYCGSKAELKENVLFGLVSEFYIDCNSCAMQSTFKSSPVFESSNHDYEINTRITYAMRTLGVGLRGIKTFCSVMDLPPPVSQKSYDRILNNIKSASFIVAVASMNKAAKEEIAASETNEICVSGDGTWKTRGHTSRIGVCSIIGDITGKVIDVEVLSSYCKGCDRWKSLKYGTAYQEWKKSNEPYCVKNHSGSSNKMEVEGMKRIFKRSLLERNAKYVKYIGDGDTKTFPELQNTVSYNLEKIECVGHIQKRMGARLRRLKLVNRGKKLSDGKSISGKNRLTDKLINKFTT